MRIIGTYTVMHNKKNSENRHKHIYKPLMYIFTPIVQLGNLCLGGTPYIIHIIVQLNSTMPKKPFSNYISN